MAEPTDTATTVDDVNTNTVNNGNDGTDDQKTSDNKDKSVPLATFLGMKDTVKRLEDKLKDLEDEKKAQKDAKLIEDGELQEVIDSKTSELADLQAKLATAETVADESKAFKAMQVEKYKKRIGSKWLDEYANLSLIALESLADSLAPKKIGSDNGADDEIIKAELDADQKRDATAKYPHVSEEKAYEYHRHNLIKTGKIKEK